MVDSISNGPVSTLLRAQSSGLLNATQKASDIRPIIDQTSNGARPSTVQQPVRIIGASGDLPRGSLVDILA